MEPASATKFSLEQHQQLQALFCLVEQGKREWEQSLDCINDVVILADNHNIIRRINKAVEQVFNTSITDAIDKDWQMFLPPGTKELSKLDNEVELHDELRDKWLRYQRFPLTQQTLVTQISQIIIISDTSKIWHLTRELASAYEKQKMSQMHMVHQEKMASIGQLAAGVAHEINNPTGFITSNLVSLGKYISKFNAHISYLEQIIAQQNDEETQAAVKEHKKKLKIAFIQEDVTDLLEESLDGAQRIKVIVQNLKSFSRVDDTGFSTNDLHQCLDAALSIAWNEIKYCATVTKDYQDIPEIYCSAQQLNQVFLNLLVNAAQAIDKMGEITVRTFTAAPWVVIEISDNGSGIAEENLSHIFEPFFTTKDVGKGTGLGLSICYDIIQKHHGTIDVSSTMGKGTTFSIKLPINTAANKQEQSDKRNSPHSSSG